MHPEPDVPLVPNGGLSRVQSHAHAHLAVIGPRVLGQYALGCNGGGESRVSAGESEEKRVPLGIDLATVARFCGLA